MRTKIGHGRRPRTRRANPPAPLPTAPRVPGIGQGLTGHLGPAPSKRHGLRPTRGLWLLVIAILGAAAAVIGSWILPAVLTPPSEDAGYAWIVFAPASGFIGGLIVGYAILWRRVGLLGFAAALGAFAAAELLVWVVYPAAPDDAALLPLHLAIPGVPFVMGCLLGAIAGAAWERPGGAARAASFFSHWPW
jgi:hypothetical protein